MNSRARVLLLVSTLLPLLSVCRTVAADPRVAECLSANESSIKLRDDHKLKDARAQSLVCASASCPDEVRSECERRVTEIARAIPSIVFDAVDAAGNDLSAITVTMDGQPFASRLDGSAIELDPGEHAFAFDSGGKHVQKSFVIRESEKARKERIVFEAPRVAADAAGSGRAAAGPPTVPAQETGAGATGASGWPIQKTLALVAGGAGGVLVVVGGIFGLSASSKWSQAKSDCGSGCGPNDPAQGERSDAQSAATISTIGFIAGGALVAAGAVLWFTAPSGAESQGTNVRIVPAAGARNAGLAVLGRF